jgi:hypothetical protein
MATLTPPLTEPWKTGCSGLPNRSIRFVKWEHPVWSVTTIIQLLDVPVLKSDVPVSTG